LANVKTAIQSCSTHSDPADFAALELLPRDKPHSILDSDSSSTNLGTTEDRTD
jgi:hypothetical protein